MEPIRPDKDELRASREGEGRPSPSKKAGKKAGGRGAVLYLALLALAVVGAAGWYQQSQRIAQMESQLEEAEYWARQSKLALARFEGELSETGEDLQEKGQSIEERFSAQSQRLDTADSEIRKLWGVANDRNKSRLNAHESRLDKLDQTAQSLAQAQKLAASERQSLVTKVGELKKSLGSELASLESQLNQRLASQSERLGSQGADIEQAQAALATVDESVQQLKRSQREQSLTMNGLDGRIAALEKTTRSLSDKDIESLRSDLASLKQTVSAIDASRAQLTSRLVRVSEEVSQLRSQVVDGR